MALGKLGGRELTVHSDLDLVVIYRGDPSDGRTFLGLQRFVEELERCLEEPTDEGVAYSIDTRLRPEGKKGALAMPLDNFVRYLSSREQKSGSVSPGRVAGFWPAPRRWVERLMPLYRSSCTVRGMRACLGT